MTQSFTAPAKDPAAVLDYEMDWSAWLAVGETLQSTPLPVVTPSDPALTVSNIAVADQTKVRFRVGGGAAAANYTITVRITTSIGQVDERTILFPVRER